MDQAALLRTIANRKSTPRTKATSRKNRKFTRVITVTSGKGGVGKTNIIANLAIALRRRNKEVLLLDADLGLANIDVLLGLTPKYNLMHVLNNEKTIDDVIIEGPAGIRVLPAASGIEDLAHLDDGAKLLLMEKLEHLWRKFDYMLVDTGAGISPNVIYFNLAAQETIIVVTAEPTSITDAYAVMKILSKNYQQHRFSIIVNMISSEREARMIFENLTKVTDRFLNIFTSFCGFVIQDKNLTRAVRRQQPFIEMFPNTIASTCIHNIAKTIDESHAQAPPNSGLGFFWQKMMSENNKIL